MSDHDSNLTVVRGTITATSFETVTGRELHVTLKDVQGSIFTISYPYRDRNIIKNMSESLAVGLAVECRVKGKFRKEHGDYVGVGVVGVIDAMELQPEWQYVHDQLYEQPLPGFDQRGDRFTPEEVRLIRETVRRAQTKIQAHFSPAGEKSAKINKRLDDLESKAITSSKTDWKKWFVTAIVGIAVDLGTGLSVVQTLIDLFKGIVADIVHSQLNGFVDDRKGLS